MIFSAHRSDQDSERSHPRLLLNHLEVLFSTQLRSNLLSVSYQQSIARCICDPFSERVPTARTKMNSMSRVPRTRLWNIRFLPVQRESGIFIPLKWSQSSNTLQVLRRVNMLVTKRYSYWKNLLRSCDLSALDTRNICLLFRPRCNKQRRTLLKVEQKPRMKLIIWFVIFII